MRVMIKTYANLENSVEMNKNTTAIIMASFHANPCTVSLDFDKFLIDNLCFECKIAYA